VFDEFMGRDQWKTFDDPLTQEGCTLWLERVLCYFGENGGVDVEIIDGQLGLTAKTADHLYSDFTPLDLHYVPGSRPMLERVVAEVVSDGMSERKKALALMRRCRDNQDMGLASPDLFCGGSEEELLKRGAIMCNEVSRVYICLCQVAGLPARPECAHISGHMMTEVYAEGKWQWVDPMKGMAPVNDDDEPASAWELMQDPTLHERQPKSYWDDVRPPSIPFGTKQRDPRNLAFSMARNRDCYFNSKEAVAIGNYYVWEHDEYTFPWHNASKDPAREERSRHAATLNKRALGWPDHYFNAQLLGEELKMRESS
jgi:transglutaminase superfamily protein